MNRKKSIISQVVAVTLMLITISMPVYAQTRILSPYSRYGIGDILTASSPQITALGGITNAYRNNNTVNFENPASYTAFDSLSCVFEGSLRSSFSQYTMATKGDLYAHGSLNTLLFGFPILKWWRSSIGLVPVSSVGFKDSTIFDDANTGLYKTFNDGYGGFNKLYFGNGFKIGKFSVGVNVAYMFGQLNSIEQLSYPQNTFSIRTENAFTVKDFVFNGGIQFQHTFKKCTTPAKSDTIKRMCARMKSCMNKVNDNLELVIGLTGGNGRALDASEEILTTRYITSSGILLDTTYNLTHPYSAMYYPASWGAGLMLRNKKWLIGADYSFSQWSEYYNFSNYTKLGELNKHITDSWSAGAGIEYTVKKMKFRMGGKYTQTNLKFDFKQIEQKSISVGVGVPFKGSKNMMNISLEFGERGTEKFGLAKEQYIKAIFALSIYERWFVKPKYN